MSIYATLRDWRIGDRTVYFQGVPSWVDHECSYLPPPIPDEELPDGRIAYRVIVVVDDLTDKGGDGYGSQQYHTELVRLTRAEYDDAMSTPTKRNRLRRQLRRQLDRAGVLTTPFGGQHGDQ